MRLVQSGVLRSAVSGALVAGIVSKDAKRAALVFGAVFVADWLVSTVYRMKQGA